MKAEPLIAEERSNFTEDVRGREENTDFIGPGSGGGGERTETEGEDWMACELPRRGFRVNGMCFVG